MNLAKIDTIIEALRFERYRWTAVRRTYIEKRHSTKKRPLGIPTWSDRLVQEVIRLILDAYYEPQFSDYSHGFRPERGCHTALREIYRKWNGTTWFIEGDIAQYFDKLDHRILIEMLVEKIQDGRFLRLVHELLRAGYLENWRFNKTLSGVPQGGIVSPVLANLYLDQFDKWVEQRLLPMYNRGTKRKPNIEQRTLRDQARYLRRTGRYRRAAAPCTAAQRMPSIDTQDPEYRRLRYVRYADDFLLGFAGPRSEAEAIKQHVAEFLREALKLDLSDEKNPAHACEDRGCTIPGLRGTRPPGRYGTFADGAPTSQRRNRPTCTCGRREEQMPSIPERWFPDASHGKTQELRSDHP